MQNSRRKQKMISLETLRRVKSKLDALAYTPKGRDLLRGFQRLDRDRDGVLNWVEFKRGIRTRTKLSNAETWSVFCLIDNEGTGSIKFENYSNFMRASPVMSDMCYPCAVQWDHMFPCMPEKYPQEQLFAQHKPLRRKAQSKATNSRASKLPAPIPAQQPVKMNPQEQLRDWASLLLALYQEYFETAPLQRHQLDSATRFLRMWRQCGLLDARLSHLHVDQVCDGVTSMSYDAFYAGIAKVAQIKFPSESSGEASTERLLRAHHAENLTSELHRSVSGVSCRWLECTCTEGMLGLLIEFKNTILALFRTFGTAADGMSLEDFQRFAKRQHLCPRFIRPTELQKVFEQSTNRGVVRRPRNVKRVSCVLSGFIEALLTMAQKFHVSGRIRPARAADRLRNFLQYLKEHVPSGLVAPGQLIDVPNSHSERPKSFERRDGTNNGATSRLLQECFDIYCNPKSRSERSGSGHLSLAEFLWFTRSCEALSPSFTYVDATGLFYAHAPKSDSFSRRDMTTVDNPVILLRSFNIVVAALATAVIGARAHANERDRAVTRLLKRSLKAQYHNQHVTPDEILCKKVLRKMLTRGVMQILSEQNYSLLSLFRQYCDENPISSPEQPHSQQAYDVITNTQQFEAMSRASFLSMASDFHLQQRPQTRPNHVSEFQLNRHLGGGNNIDTNADGKTARIVSDVLLLNSEARNLHFNAFTECLLVTAWRSQLGRSHPKRPDQALEDLLHWMDPQHIIFKQKQEDAGIGEKHQDNQHVLLGNSSSMDQVMVGASEALSVVSQNTRSRLQTIFAIDFAAEGKTTPHVTQLLILLRQGLCFGATTVAPIQPYDIIRVAARVAPRPGDESSRLGTSLKGSEHWMSIKPKWNFLELLTVIVNVAIFTTKPELQVKRHGQQLSRVQYQEQIRSLCQYVQRGSEWFQRHKTDPASPTMKEVHELTRIYSIGAWAELWNSRTALGCIFWRYANPLGAGVCMSSQDITNPRSQRIELSSVLQFYGDYGLSPAPVSSSSILAHVVWLPRLEKAMPNTISEVSLNIAEFLEMIVRCALQVSQRSSMDVAARVGIPRRAVRDLLAFMDEAAGGGVFGEAKAATTHLRRSEMQSPTSVVTSASHAGIKPANADTVVHAHPNPKRITSPSIEPAVTVDTRHISGIQSHKYSGPTPTPNHDLETTISGNKFNSDPDIVPKSNPDRTLSGHVEAVQNEGGKLRPGKRDFIANVVRKKPTPRDASQLLSSAPSRDSAAVLVPKYDYTVGMHVALASSPAHCLHDAPAFYHKSQTRHKFRGGVERRGLQLHEWLAMARDFGLLTNDSGLFDLERAWSSLTQSSSREKTEALLRVATRLFGSDTSLNSAKQLLYDAWCANTRFKANMRVSKIPWVLHAAMLEELKPHLKMLRELFGKYKSRLTDAIASRNGLSLVDFIAFCRDFHLTEILFLGESQTAVMENLYFHSSAQVNRGAGVPEWVSVCLFPHFLDCLARLSIIAFPTGKLHLRLRMLLAIIQRGEAVDKFD